MKAMRWNFKTHDYEPCEVPKGAVMCCDMKQTVQCACCGEYMRYGDGYTSRRIHTSGGLGFAVCEDCYREEWIEESKAHGRT